MKKWQVVDGQRYLVSGDNLGFPEIQRDFLPPTFGYEMGNEG